MHRLADGPMDFSAICVFRQVLYQTSACDTGTDEVSPTRVRDPRHTVLRKGQEKTRRSQQLSRVHLSSYRGGDLSRPSLGVYYFRKKLLLGPARLEIRWFPFGLTRPLRLRRRTTRAQDPTIVLSFGQRVRQTVPRRSLAPGLAPGTWHQELFRLTTTDGGSQ